MRKILLILIMVAFLMTDFVWAVGLKVRPAEIKIETTRGVLVSQKILVENPGDNVALFEIYPDNFSDWIKVKPESFTLEKGEEQKVSLEIKAQDKGLFSTMLSIVAKPFSQRKFQANSGIKIPLEVRISEVKGESVFLASLYNILKEKVSVFRLLVHLVSAAIVLLLVLKLLKYKYAQ